MNKQIVLTGIKPSGTPHVGNYFGSLKPAIEASGKGTFNEFFFIADYHALTTVKDKDQMAFLVKDIACTWLACGLDPKKSVIYRQSDVPEVFELATILGNVTPKGLMNRAHAYKAAVAANSEAGREGDHGVNMGLYTYPILMAADILLFDTNFVPVGQDQKQHIEIAADIGAAINAIYGKVLTIPKAQIDEATAVVPGLDGRKMSKSYGNIIPLFAPPQELLKSVKSIKTDSSAVGDPKPLDSLVFVLYKLFATADQTRAMEEKFKKGIGWGEAKAELFDVMNFKLSPMRDRYNYLMANYLEVENILRDGATRARTAARQTIARVRAAIGVD